MEGRRRYEGKVRKETEGKGKNEKEGGKKEKGREDIERMIKKDDGIK